MKILKAAPVTFALLTMATGIASATVAHYVDGGEWAISYLVAAGGGLMSAFAAIVAED